LKAVVKQMRESIQDIDDPYEIVHRLNDMTQSKAFRDYCQQLSYTMVTHVNNQVKGGWRKAAIENGRGREIFHALAQEIANTNIGLAVSEQTAINAGIIVTLPYDISKEITDFIEAEAFTGRRSSDIAKEIKSDFPKRTQARAELIARTEVSKTQCALTKARAESLGLGWYIWRTSKDSRVRSSHDLMDGVLVKWSDPPNPEKMDPGTPKNQIRQNYHAGNIYNCRCYPEPVIDIWQIEFPHKVHVGGRIVKVTRQEFLKIAA